MRGRPGQGQVAHLDRRRRPVPERRPVQAHLHLNRFERVGRTGGRPLPEQAPPPVASGVRATEGHRGGVRRRRERQPRAAGGALREDVEGRRASGEAARRGRGGALPAGDDDQRLARRRRRPRRLAQGVGASLEGQPGGVATALQRVAQGLEDGERRRVGGAGSAGSAAGAIGQSQQRDPPRRPVARRRAPGSAAAPGAPPQTPPDVSQPHGRPVP